MSSNIRHFSAIEDYQTICSWWQSHKWPSIPLDHLPQEGFIAEIAGIPALAAWLYKTDSAICWLEFTVANPNITGLERDEAFKALYSHMIEYSKELGFKTMFTSVANKKLITRLEDFGFTQTDSEMTNLIKGL